MKKGRKLPIMNNKPIQNFHQLSREKGLKIVHLNIRSLFRKVDQLRCILEGSNIDIFTISETWLHPNIDSRMIDIEGYTAYRSDRCSDSLGVKKRGGGLITYIKNGSYSVSSQNAENVSNKDLEIQWFKIKRDKTKTITLANVYRPPTGKVDQAIKIIEKGLNSIARPTEEVVILGDFNIDYKNKKSLNFTKIKFFERANAFEQKICTTTRKTMSSSSILDVAFTNMKYIKEAGTIDTFISDHQPIFLLKKKCRNTEKSEQQFQGRSYRNYNKQEFTDSILAQKWDYFYDAPDAETAWAEMERIITWEADKQCPIRTYKIRNTKPSWLTNEIIEQMKDRDYFYQKAKRYNSEDDWNIAKFHRNQTNFNVRKAKADFIKEQLKNSEGNSSKFWRTIKQIIPSKKGSAESTKIMISDTNNEIIEGEKIADYMNCYFANLGSPPNTTRNPPSPPNLPNKTHSPPSAVGHDRQIEENIFNIMKILKIEVQVLIDKINVSKSSGIDFLSSKLLKDSFQVLADKLTYLYNLSVAQGIFPTQWKKAFVIPIPKIGNPKKVENYRPISLLPLPGKLLEKLVHTQLSLYLEEEEILTNNQFGFRKQRSTSHAISQVLNQIYTNINRSNITAAVYIDFSKAFNSVQHSTLIAKLTELNLSAKTIEWITSYLHGRRQRTLANNTYSANLPVNQGVPQGSVLGPLLYIIYANDIVGKIKNSGFTFYADDTVLYSKKKSLVQSCEGLQEDLDNLSDWCNENDIFINTKKTKIMFFGSKAKIESTDLPNLRINDNIIQRAKTYTYLGIKLDEQLSLDTQAQAVIRKVSTKIYQLTKMRPFLSKKAALLVYKNMILPILEYGDIFIHSASKKSRKKLQTLQNKALKCALSKDKLYNTENLHNEAKLLKLKDRRHVHILLHMFQLAQIPGFKLWKAYQTTGVKTRSSKKKLISFRRPNNERYRKSITYQGPKLWNSLPAHIQKMDSYHDFKIQTKKLFHLRAQQKQRPNTKTSAKSKPKTQNLKPKIQKPKTKPKMNFQHPNRSQPSMSLSVSTSKGKRKSKRNTKCNPKPNPNPIQQIVNSKLKHKPKPKPKSKPNRNPKSKPKPKPKPVPKPKPKSKAKAKAKPKLKPKITNK